MEKARSRAQLVLETMRNDPNVDLSKPESEWTFKAVLLGPNGPQETEVRVTDLLVQAAPLKELAAHCRQCPANIRRDDFGCGGAVHYPITAQAERWLLSRLPNDLSTGAGELLLRALDQVGFDGAHIDLARSRKELYESRSPIVRKWGSLFSKRKLITSSQILQMAFGVGNLEPTHAKMIAYFVGFLDHDFKVIDSAANRAESGDDRITIELKYFFSSAALAGSNGVAMMVDA